MIQKFEFKETSLKGAYEITPFYATDERGGFVKDYNIDTFKANGIDYELKEVFYTISKRGVIRATHFQLVKQQAKLVRCISGHVYDVIVDLRPDSPTFGQWQGFDLTGENQKTLYIPQYFGHGYLVIEDSIVSYKCGEVFYGDSQRLVDAEHKTFKQADIEALLNRRGIAIFDTATAVKRLSGNASDKDLEVVEKTDIAALLERIPQCHDIVCTGQKSISVLAEDYGVTIPKMGEYSTFAINGREMRLWRMPSSSRAYPMPLAQKAVYYRKMMETITI